MNEKRNFTTREWILLTLFLSVLQGVIWYASFVNAHNGTALNYISFAGTLISIILAVLAIGYTYGESISEKNKSNAISNQIETLNKVLANLTIQSNSLDKISTIKDELISLSNKFSEGTSNTHKKVEDLKQSVDNFIEFKESSEKANFTKNQKDSLIEIIAKSTAISIKTPLKIIYYISVKNFNSTQVIGNTKLLFEEADKICESSNINKTNPNLYYGAIAAFLNLLKQNDLLTENNNIFSLDNVLKTKIENWLIPTISPEEYSDVLNNVLIDKIKT